MTELVNHDTFKGGAKAGQCKKKCLACHHAARLALREQVNAIAEAKAAAAAEEIQPEEVSDDSTTSSAATDDTPLARTLGQCKRCYNQGEPVEVWTSHSVHNCPAIMNHICELCDEKGHYVNCCPNVKNVLIACNVNKNENYQILKTFKYAIYKDKDFLMLFKKYGSILVTKGCHPDVDGTYHYTFVFKDNVDKFHLYVRHEHFPNYEYKEWYVGFSKRVVFKNFRVIY